MDKFGQLLIAILVVVITIWVFQMVWNHGVRKAITVVRPIDFMTSLLLVLVLFPTLIPLVAGWLLLPSNLLGYFSDKDIDIRVRKGRPPSPPPFMSGYAVPSSEDYTQPRMYPSK